MKIRSAHSLRGTIQLPGDKSISHRAAMLAAMAIGETRIENFATSADCLSTLSCLAALGVGIRRENGIVIINGVGKTGFLEPSQPLNCGNSGTTMRLLAGILAGQNFESTLVGDESLHSRPMRRVIRPLGEMGVIITSNEGKAPLTISGKNPLDAIEYTPPVASAQIKSLVLLAGLNSNGVTTVLESAQTRDHTERMLEWFGVEVATEARREATKISVNGDASLKARDIAVPSDFSSAAFFMVAAACLKGSDVRLTDVGVNPSRRAILNILRGLGANIKILNRVKRCNEDVATIRIRGGLRGGKEGSWPALRGKIIANLIDEIPILAVFGTQLESGLEIRDAAELRVKESDRIGAIVQNLGRMGADVTEFADGFRVGRSDLKGAVIDSFGDHRIAMGFAIAALLAEGETEIAGAECADVSFPGFFESLDAVVNQDQFPANKAN